MEIPGTIVEVHEDGSCTVREKFSRNHWKDHERVPMECISAGKRRRKKA